MSGLGLELLLLCVLNQVQAQAAPLLPDVPPTRMGTELLARRPHVVLARTRSATNFGIGTAVVRLTIEETLLGASLEAGDEAVVLAYAGHFVPGGRNLVYLRPYGEGGRWAVFQRVDGRDPCFRAKLRVTRRTIELLTLPDRERRQAATLGLLFELLERPDAWSRGYALGELRWIARHRRELFDETTTRHLQRIGRASPHADVAAGVESVTILLPLIDGPLRRPPQSESSLR